MSCDGSSAGGYNEVWHFAEPFRSAIVDTMRLRESLRPYIQSLYARASTDGSPVIRMLRYEFAEDIQAAAVDDQFMLGSQYLVAPVLVENSTSRSVYLPVLPAGEGWRPHFNTTSVAAQDGSTLQLHVLSGGAVLNGDGRDRIYRGGQHVVVSTPLASFPLYKRVTAPIAMETQV